MCVKKLDRTDTESSQRSGNFGVTAVANEVFDEKHEEYRSRS